MTDKQQDLVRRWSAVLSGAGAAIDWVREVRGNAKQLDNEADDLIRQLRRVRNQARDLGRVSATPMTIGFFGVSQAGKSHLLSSLAASDDGRLGADYGGQHVDFIDHVNPPGGGKESTGLVTRFTRREVDVQDPAFPVEVRLFREIDLAKILANAWFSDFDREQVAFVLDEHSVDKALGAYAGREDGPIPADSGMNEDDVISLWDYVQGNWGSSVAFLENGYWSRVLQLAPRLATRERARLFSVLWGGLDELSRVYEQVADSLRRLGHAELAYVSLDALVRRSGDTLQANPDSIMSVDILNRLGRGNDVGLSVRPAHEGSLAPAVSIPASHLAALTTELVFPLVQRPCHKSVEAVDLLDFPGYRGRFNVASLDRIPRDTADSDPVAQLLLRGKVAYLFERYTESQEMNGLVMCVNANTPFEVTDVVKVLENWVHRTQGDSAASRGSRKCGLFWVMTKMDTRIESILRLDDGQVAKTCDDLIKQTLDDRFGSEEWMRQWAPGQPFDNCYMARKPGYGDYFIDISGGVEHAVRPERQDKLQAVRRTFVASAEIRKRFADPDAAWTALLTLNDGGMARLGAAIDGIADLDYKLKRLYDQLHDNLAGKSGVFGRLKKYHQHVDAVDADEKQAVAATLVTGLGSQYRKVPELLHVMELSSEDLRELYLRPNVPTPADAVVVEQPSEPVAPFNPFAALVGADAVPPTPVARVREVMPLRKTGDHLFAEVVFQRWLSHLRDLPARHRLLESLQISGDTVQALVDELITGAHRLRLQEKLEQLLTQRQDSGSKREQLASRQVLRAQTVLRDFLAWQGWLDVDAAQRPTSDFNQGRRLFESATALDANGLPDLPEREIDMAQAFLGYWFTGLKELVLSNAGHLAGREITREQNETLGRIFQTLTRD
ncbi:virulence factor [Bordetella ansorpii]|uniref:Virulence factor n=1 Tax=Bordetella ansorpii TaxID=288768 RepID=A0A157Q0K6_9BORD|nr:virulence factor SrfC family protein [Bordetella ansorpii]SAI39138.1 virulence factor [Bordetella ansorpii]